MADQHSDAEKVAEATGLSRRASEWAALAALHSGVFTRKQLAAGLGIGNDSTGRRETSRVVAELRDANLATEIDVAGIKVVHIHGKAIYQALGEQDNRNRRKPSREKALERLLALDYVLDHPDENWLPTERAKTAALEAAGIPQDTWSSTRYEAPDESTTRHFVEKWPLAIDAASRRGVLACVSPGSTDKRLKNWLRDWDPLIRAFGAAGFAVRLVHIASRSPLSDRAETLLAKAAAKFGADDDEDLATIRKIKTAILADREEAFEPLGGLQQALQISREIYARRGKGFEAPAAQPVDVETKAWTSTRIQLAERQK